MSKRAILILLVALLIGPALFAQSDRGPGDFVTIALDEFNLDSVRQNYIEGERMGANYRFYPAVRNGRVVGYLWWGKDFLVANHLEDVMFLIGVDGNRAVLRDFWISYNDHHLNMGEQATEDMFAGMTYDENWNESVDVVSGSTLSSYTVFNQAKKALFVFEKYVIETGLL